MSSIFYYDAYKIERNNKRTGFLISAILHALLLLIILWRFLETPLVEETTIEVVLLMPVKEIFQDPEIIPGGGSSAGPESEEPKEGGSKGSEASPALEELEKQPDKIDVIKPTPTPTPTPPSPKPVVVVTEPQVVVIPPAKTKTDPIPTKPSPPVVSPNPPVVNKPKPTQGGGTGSAGNASTGDDDAPGTGGTGSGSGAGGSGSGGASSGSGTGGGGNAGSGTGTGSGDGTGVDFDETGPLKRAVCKRANINELAREYVQSAVFNMCINQQGDVTHIKYNSRLSKTKDKSFIIEATRKMQQYEFCVDLKAPRKECGTFTFQIAGVKYQLVK